MPRCRGHPFLIASCARLAVAVKGVGVSRAVNRPAAANKSAVCSKEDKGSKGPPRRSQAFFVPGRPLNAHEALFDGMPACVSRGPVLYPLGFPSEVCGDET